MKTLLVSLMMALLVTAPFTPAFAEEDPDDVFLDDGGMIETPPEADAAAAATSPEGEGGEPVALPESEPDPMDVPPPTEPAKVAQPAPEPEEDDSVDEPAPQAKPKAKVQQAKKAKEPVEKVTEKVAAKPKAKSAKTSRKVASKEGFRTTKAECEMHKSAAADSPVLITVAASRKLWVEEHNEEWVKAFRKTGHGFISRDCFE
ncbi:MAG: hypothetical protein NDI61_08940 [Bdellovibrionaceae bacterium]|nr:hypothetical protein [Pseudobdellovibrionaceae bacterium]